MIDREKLKEMIKNNDKIYVVNQFNSNARTISNEILEKDIIDFIYDIFYYNNYIFETIDDAKFYIEYQNINKSLTLPTWEEITTNDKYKCFDFINFESNNIKIVVKLPNENDDFEHVSIAYNDKLIDYWGKATKENYIKVCEAAKKLFLGEKEEE